MNSVDNNRIILSNLIFELNEFDEEQLLAALRERTNGATMIDPRQSVGEYLDELVDMKILYFNDEKYHVIPVSV